MAEAYDRGKNFEQRVASMLRKKLGAKVVRDRRSGAGTNRSDISDYYQEIPLHLEIKDQENVKIKEWFKQADDASSFMQAPTVIFAKDEEILACLRFSDLLNFLIEIADQKAEIDDLRAPIPAPNATIGDAQDGKVSHISAGKPMIERQIKERMAKLTYCKGGHLADLYGYCMILDCKFSRGYKKPKGKKK